MTQLASRDFLDSRDFPFFAHRYDFAPGESIAPHSHEFVEFVYVAAGRGEHRYLDRVDRIAEGDVFVIAPGAEHAYACSPDESLHVYNVLFDAHFFTDELTTLAKVTPFVDFFYVEPLLRERTPFHSRLTLGPRDRMEVQYWLDSLVREIQMKELGYRILIKTRLIELFVYLSRCYDMQKRFALAALPDDEIMESVCAFIDRHCAQTLTLPQMCQLCGMSQSTFTAKFKRYTGRTFLEYRNERRIRMAKELLAKTGEKVVSIAADVGFADLSLFNRTFRELVGLPPTRFREAARGKKDEDQFPQNGGVMIRGRL